MLSALQPRACARLRRSMAALAVALGATISAKATSSVPVFEWKLTPLNSDIVNAASNWTLTSGEAGGSPQSTDNAELIFKASSNTTPTLNSSLDVYKLKFTDSFPSYTLSGTGTFGLDSGGIIVDSTGSGTITFASSLSLSLRANQTWTVNRALTVNSTIRAETAGASITKNGSETLTLSGSSTFDGGVNVSSGTLIVGASSTGSPVSSGPVGTGTLTLGGGTTLAASAGTITLGNHVHLSGTTVQFGQSGATGTLVFTGSVEFESSGVNTVTSSATQVQFNGELEASSTAQATFVGTGTFILGGKVKSTVTHITAGNSSTAGSVLFGDIDAVTYTDTGTGGPTIASAKIGSYVGLIDSDFTSTTGLQAFLNRITSPSTFQGLIGFDTPSGSGTLSYVGGTGNGLNLNSFTHADFEGLATATSAILDSSLLITAPSSGTVRLAGVKGGIFDVRAPLLSNRSVIDLKINQTTADESSSAVILSSTSSNYSGGTTLSAGYLLFGAGSTLTSGSISSGPLGTGTLTLNDSSTGTLSATTSGLLLHNPIVIGASGQLRLGLNSSAPTGIAAKNNNTFELSGEISGDGKLFVQNSSGTITLSHANAFAGGADLATSGLVTKALNALGGADNAVHFSGSSALTLQSANLAIGTLTSAASTSSTISLGSNTLSIYQNNPGTFRGVISGTGSVAKHNAGELTIEGASTFTGGTTIHSGKVILSGSTTTLGASTSGITVNNGGTLIANSGVTVANPLTLNSGSRLGGAGTFGGAVVANSGVTLAPGSSPGTLTFSNGLTLNGGSTIEFEIRDANAALTPGTSSSWDLLSISGTLALNASSGTPLTIQIKSLNSDLNSGDAANFNAGNPYAWTFATASSITGFNATHFSINRSGFTNSSVGDFFVSQSGNSLLLNFTPVPEPETYVLMGTGLSLIAAAAWKRRRRREP